MRPVNIPHLDELLAGATVQRAEHLRDDDLRQLGLCFDPTSMWLADDAQPLDPSRLRARLSARAQQTWPELSVVSDCESTNKTLMAKVSAGAAAGQALTTEYQWGGRGRRGRGWLSPVARNLAVSVVWEATESLSQLAGLSLVVGVACADALHTLGLARVALKWPNDLIVLPNAAAMAQAPGYAKLGGILVELQSQSVGSAAVIGIGLNFGGAALVRPRVEQSLADIAELRAELDEHRRSRIDRTEVLAAVLNALADYLAEFATTGFAPMVPVWNELHAFTGQQVVVGDPADLAKGQTGIVMGVTETGELRLKTSAGEYSVGAGEVSLRPGLPLTDESTHSSAETSGGPE